MRRLVHRRHRFWRKRSGRLARRSGGRRDRKIFAESRAKMNVLVWYWNRCSRSLVHCRSEAWTWRADLLRLRLTDRRSVVCDCRQTSGSSRRIQGSTENSKKNRLASFLSILSDRSMLALLHARRLAQPWTTITTKELSNAWPQKIPIFI